MPILLKIFQFAVLGGVLVASPAGAQVRKKGQEIEVRYVTQVAPKDLGMVVMVGLEEVRSEPFGLPLNGMSDRQIAPGRIFKLELEERPMPLAAITLPEEGKDFIILLVPDRKAGFEPVVIPADSDSFRPGDFYLHNVSKQPVFGKVGTTDFSLKHRSGKVVRPKGVRENRFYDVLIGTREAQQNRLISSSRWPLQKQMRTYVFFFDNPVRGDVDFRAVDEFVPAEKDE